MWMHTKDLSSPAAHRFTSLITGQQFHGVEGDTSCQFGSNHLLITILDVPGALIPTDDIIDLT